MDAKFRVMATSNGVLLKIEGDLDLAVCPQLRRLTQSEELSSGTVTLDIGGVTFIDCSGILPLEETRLRLEAVGGRLEISTASACVRRVSALAGYAELATLSRAHDHGLAR